MYASTVEQLEVISNLIAKVLLCSQTGVQLTISHFTLENGSLAVK
jgi:hypothetical protein